MAMMITNETYTLSNGVQIPKLMLGTWLLNDEEAEQAVKDAIALGYTGIDTAEAYGNEEGVGKGIRESGVEREKLFITTKVVAEAKSYDEAAKAIDESLAKLDIGYIDLIIIHAPQPWAEFRGEKRYFEENKEAWRALEDAYEAGKVRAIGVSNFMVDDLENILSDCRVKPMVNQVLAHISNTPFEWIDFCEKNGILVEAYSPVAHGVVLDNAEIKEIADKYGVSVSQLCLKYDIQLGMVVLPKTANPDHMKENAELDFTISDEDMEVLKGMKKIEDYGRDGFFPVFAKG